MIGGGTSRKRGKRARDASYTIGIVEQGAGVVTTDVSSNNGVTVFGDTWLIHGPWFDTDQIEDNATTEIT